MTTLSKQDATIAAISTPPGAGGIGIIRMSGDKALDIIKQIFQRTEKQTDFQSHRFYYGTIVDPANDHTLDEVLMVFMAAPRTYTREDVVEIHGHGSYLVLQSVLELLVEQGAELAEPGAFTKRAFLNGRIDLTRAEAVIDILAAKTRKGVDLALEQLSGRLYHQVDHLRQQLVEVRALFEVAIDFPDEDIEIFDRHQLLERLRQELLVPLGELIGQAASGRIIREGISVVIVGVPNVGKSSLLNTLLQEERALVTEIPGTTRDTIEAFLDINGMPVRLVDTAGIREPAELVEQLGIERARDQVNRADLVMFLADGSRAFGPADRQLFLTVNHKPLIVVRNKGDLPQKIEVAAEPDIFAESIMISALTQDGIAQLKQTIFQRVTGGAEQWSEEGCRPNVRQKAALVKARAAAEAVCQGLQSGLPNDLLTIDIVECLDHLGAIIGETTTEDVLDLIFEQFCLGK